MVATIVLELCAVYGGLGLDVAALPRPGSGSLEVRCLKRLRGGRVPEQADAIETLAGQLRIGMLKATRVVQLARQRSLRGESLLRLHRPWVSALMR